MDTIAAAMSSMPRPSIEQVRAELPGLVDCVHLNTGGAGPMPRVALDALRAALDEDGSTARMSEAGVERMDRRRADLRQALAGLLHVDGTDIAIVPSVTFALNAVVHGIDWQPGDRVITTTHEHPALLAPLKVVAERFGVIIDVVPLSDGDEPLADECAHLATDRTRLIALSHVSWVTGATLDIAGAVDVARSVGALTLVDGAQSAGAIAVDPVALGVDAYALNAPKWTLGPQGLGALWIREEPRDRIRPTFTGLGSTVGSHGHMAWHDEARRYELGALPEILLPAWTASLQWLNDLGEPWIAERTAQIRAYARDALQAFGADILTPPSATSGILTFRLNSGDAATVVHQLEQRGIITRLSLQTDAIRASMAFFTTPSDVDTLIGGLAELRA